MSWRSDELGTRCDRESQHPAELALRPPIDQLQFGDQMSWRQDAVEKASTQQSGHSGPRLSSCSWREDDGMRTCSREAGLPGPRLSSLGERERNAVMANRVGVNMLQFCSVSNSFSHTTFSNKMRGIFFLKTCVARLYCVVYMFCTQMYMYYVAIQHIDLARKLKKTMEHEGDNYTNSETKILLKGLEDLVVGGRVETIIIGNSQKTEKSPGDLRELAVTQAPFDHQQKLM